MPSPPPGPPLLVTDIDKDAAVATAESITAAGGTAQPLVLDVRDSAAAKEAAAAAAELGGGTLHILVNNAGAIAPAMFADLSEENFRRIIDIHLDRQLRVQPGRIATTYRSDGTGRIINVTSAAGLTGTIGQANYGAAKAGIVGLTKSLARELARQSITVNAVAPLAATRHDGKYPQQRKAGRENSGPNSLWGGGPSRTRSHRHSSSWPQTPRPTSPGKCCRSTVGR